MQVTIDVHDIDHLPPVPPLIGMIQDLHQTALLDRGNDALELPQAGSAMGFPGSGRTHSTMARIRARGVTYCPAPDFVSSAFLSSRPS